MIGASVRIGRVAELGLPPLYIGDSKPNRYMFTERGLGRPGTAARLTYADTSIHVPGALLTQAVKEITSLPLEVLVTGTSYPDLEAALDELDDALWQFSFNVTVITGGVTRVWKAQPATWQTIDGATVHARADQFIEVVSMTIPVQPYPSGG